MEVKNDCYDVVSTNDIIDVLNNDIQYNRESLNIKLDGYVIIQIGQRDSQFKSIRDIIIRLWYCGEGHKVIICEKSFGVQSNSPLAYKRKTIALNLLGMIVGYVNSGHYKELIQNGFKSVKLANNSEL